MMDGGVERPSGDGPVTSSTRKPPLPALHGRDKGGRGVSKAEGPWSPGGSWSQHPSSGHPSSRAVQSTAGAKPRWKPADPGNAAYSVSCRAELKRPRMDLRINKLRTDPGSSPEI